MVGYEGVGEVKTVLQISREGGIVVLPALQQPSKFMHQHCTLIGRHWKKMEFQREI